MAKGLGGKNRKDTRAFDGESIRGSGGANAEELATVTKERDDFQIANTTLTSEKTAVTNELNKFNISYDAFKVPPTTSTVPDQKTVPWGLKGDAGATIGSDDVGRVWSKASGTGSWILPLGRSFDNQRVVTNDPFAWSSIGPSNPYDGFSVNLDNTSYFALCVCTDKQIQDYTEWTVHYKQPPWVYYAFIESRTAGIKIYERKNSTTTPIATLSVFDYTTYDIGFQTRKKDDGYHYMGFYAKLKTESSYGTALWESDRHVRHTDHTTATGFVEIKPGLYPVFGNGLDTTVDIKRIQLIYKGFAHIPESFYSTSTAVAKLITDWTTDQYETFKDKYTPSQYGVEWKGDPTEGALISKLVTNFLRLGAYELPQGMPITNTRFGVPSNLLNSGGNSFYPHDYWITSSSTPRYLTFNDASTITRRGDHAGNNAQWKIGAFQMHFPIFNREILDDLKSAGYDLFGINFKCTGTNIDGAWWRMGLSQMDVAGNPFYGPTNTSHQSALGTGGPQVAVQVHSKNTTGFYADRAGKHALTSDYDPTSSHIVDKTFPYGTVRNTSESDPYNRGTYVVHPANSDFTAVASSFDDTTKVVFEIETTSPYYIRSGESGSSVRSTLSNAQGRKINLVDNVPYFTCGGMYVFDGLMFNINKADNTKVGVHKWGVHALRSS